MHNIRRQNAADATLRTKQIFAEYNVDSTTYVVHIHSQLTAYGFKQWLDL